MRHIGLFSRLSMFILCFFVSLGAFAGNEVSLSIEKAYLTPGETATLTIKLNNTVVIGTVGATINLPEGITFVKGETLEDGSYVPVMGTTELSKKATVLSCTTKSNVAHFSIAKGGNKFQPGEGDLITFDVNVAKDFGIYGNITLDEGLGVYTIVNDDATFSQKTYTLDSYTTKVYNNDELCVPSVADFSIAPGEKKTITLDLQDEKHLISLLSYNVEMPAGLTIDPESYEALKERAPYHEVHIKKSGRIGIIPSGKSEELDFKGTSGSIISFDVIADNTFNGDATIKFYDFLATTKAIDGKVDQYYAKDLTVKVTKSGTATGINGIETDFAAKADGIYTVSGLKVNKLVKGVNIVVKDGKATKVVKK